MNAAQNGDMARIFISYKRADKEKVFPLKDQIEAAIGEPCQIVPDENKDSALTDQEINSYIDAASIFIFMYSKYHAQLTNEECNNDWTIKELSYAQKLKKRIVFISIDQAPLSRWLSFMFPQHQTIDGGSPEAIEHLCQDLTKWLQYASEQVSDGKPYTESLTFSYNPLTFEATVTGLEENICDKHLVIPSEVVHEGVPYTVTAIRAHAFSGRGIIHSVQIPDTVQRIGKWAFNECKNLKSVTLPSGIKQIERFTFSECTRLSSVTIPESVTFIGAYAFSHCENLLTITLPQSVSHIGRGAFSYCSSLQFVHLPEGISIIRPSLFMNCTNLNMPALPDSVRWIRGLAFSGCKRIQMMIIPKRALRSFLAIEIECNVIRKK